MSDIDTLLKEVKDMQAFVTKRLEENLGVEREERLRLAAEFTKIQAGFERLRKERLARMGEEGRLYVRNGRLAGYTSLDLRILEEVLKSRQERGRARHGELLEEVKTARKDLWDYVRGDVDAILGWADRAMRLRAVTPTGQAPAGSLRMFEGALNAWMRALVVEQQRAMDSTTAAKGDELVPTFEAAELWMDVNLDTLVLPLLPQITMPTNPFDMPGQLGDTNWYPASENVQATTTDLATAKATLTAKGLKTGVPFSDELEEDAIVTWVPELRQSLVRNAAEAIDDVLLNADQTAANGINSDGATISTSSAGKAHWLLGFDGLIHLPLVDNTAKRIDKNAAIDADIYNRVLATIGRYAVPRRRGEVVYIADVNTAVRSLSITEFETVDVAGLRATLSTGEIINVYGKPLIQSEQMRLADTDGKVTDGGNATDTGRILCLNVTQWRVGFRRQITVETDREAGKGQTTMYVSFRIALTERTGTRSSAGHTGLAYDITGVS